MGADAAADARQRVAIAHDGERIAVAPLGDQRDVPLRVDADGTGGAARRAPGLGDARDLRPEVGRRQRLGQRGRVARAALAALDERPVAPHAHAERLARRGIDADVDSRVLDVLLLAGHHRREPGVPAFTVAVERADAPRQLVVDKYGQVAKANGGRFSIGSWMSEQDKTVIVYGTSDDEVANRAAAELVQKHIRNQSYDFVIPIKSDAVITDDEISHHHLILIGRPATNRITERLQGSLPVSFDRQSFDVRGKTYGHYRSAVIAAGANPQNPRFGIVAIAGLSAMSTYLAADAVVKGNLGAEVLLMQHGEKPMPLVIPAPELTKDLASSITLSAGSSH